MFCHYLIYGFITFFTLTVSFSIPRFDRYSLQFSSNLISTSKEKTFVLVSFFGNAKQEW